MLLVRRVGIVVAVGLCVLSLPAVIILGAVRFAFSWQPVYSYAITAYHPEDTIGVPATELQRATQTIRTYFSNRQRDLDVTVADGSGARIALFNDREIAHMRDVKALVLRLYGVFDAALAVLLLSALAIVMLRTGGGRRLAKALLAGCALLGVVLLAFGAVAAVGFDQLFIEFHLLSFSNDFWELDPTTDHLVQLFPQGYWFDVTLFVVATALAAAVVCAVISATFLLLTRPQRARG
jgi:integral membrane protein (TIGR01906 family)